MPYHSFVLLKMLYVSQTTDVSCNFYSTSEMRKANMPHIALAQLLQQFIDHTNVLVPLDLVQFVHFHFYVPFQGPVCLF